MRKYFLLVLLLVIPFLSGCDDGNVDNSGFVEVKSETLTDKINSFHLEWNSGVVNINKGQDNTIIISEKAKEDFLESNMFTYDITDGTLNIKDPHYNHPVIMLEHDLDITIPDQLYNLIDLDGTSVQFNMKDFKSNKLDIYANTIEENISGDFDEVVSDFTSGEIEYKFNSLPKIINIKGYSSSGRMILPDGAEFNLNEILDESEINSEFDLEDLGDNKFKIGNPKSDITIDLRQSTFNIDENK